MTPAAQLSEFGTPNVTVAQKNAPDALRSFSSLFTRDGQEELVTNELPVDQQPVARRGDLVDQVADRLDDEGRAHDDEEVDVAEVVTLVLAVPFGKVLAKEDDVRLDEARAALAPRDVPATDDGTEVVTRVGSGAGDATSGGERAVGLDEDLFRHSGQLFEVVDVLGINTTETALLLEEVEKKV